MNHKSKLLFLTNDFPPNEGGMESCANEIYNDFKKYYDCDIIIAYPKPVKSDYNHIVVKRNFLIKQFQILITLFFKLLKFKPDHTYINTWSPFGLMTIMLSKIFRYRVFITCHGLDILEPLKSRVHKFLMKIVLNRADAIFCVSSYTKSLLFKYVKLKKNNNVYIVNNGINSKKFYIMYDDKKKDNFFLKYKDKFVLLTISRLTPRKGHLTVLKSLIKLKQYIPNIYYLVVGRGETDSVIQQFMKKNGLENYVELCGFVSDDKLIEYYNSANIFVMLSEEIIETGDVEGFGVSYIEANACGVPAIGKNCGGAIDAIKNDINGYLVEDEVEFIEKVLFLYKNKKIYENMKISSYNFVKNNFEWQKQTTKMRNLIEQHS